eukprot:jgi/Botrbrau1/9645/Bobra.0131s0021.1
MCIAILTKKTVGYLSVVAVLATQLQWTSAQANGTLSSDNPLLEYSLALGYIPAMPLVYPFQLPSVPPILQGLDPNATSSPRLPGTLSPKSLHMHYSQLMLHGVAALNATLADRPALQVKSLADLLTITLADKTVSPFARSGITKYGGALFNHILYFTTMRNAVRNNRPTAATTPNIYAKIVERWNTFERFQTAFQDMAKSVFGSGWTFLALPPNDFTLVIVTTRDEEVCFSMSEGNSGAYPILGIDLWEHSYLLDYLDGQEQYVKDWWQIVDWDRVEANLAAANKSDMDTVIRLPETTLSLNGLSPQGAPQPAPIAASTAPPVSPKGALAAVPSTVPAPGTVTAASAVATPSKASSQKSQVAPGNTGGDVTGEAYP